MAVASPSDPYRQLPSIDDLLRTESGALWLNRFPRSVVVEELRGALAEARRAIAGGREPAAVNAVADRRLRRLEQSSLRPVINATGVVLHTNLGRAPLPRSAIEAIAQTAGGYSNLEYDLSAGRRGRRDVHAGTWLERLLGAPALVVNNNAAAIFLILNELSAGGETLVSRGELVEIGDGFRIPEILEKSGAVLREVGATNRTRIEDYRAAFDPERTRLILRVHPSNFRISGFTGRPEVAELVGLGRELGVPVVDDLGSGLLYQPLKGPSNDPPEDSLAESSSSALREEPTPRRALAAGVDLVSFSGDKLLGGPQAGIITGRAELLARLRQNPLFRALRADKLVYAALEAVLRDYVLERYDDIPVLQMLRVPADELRRRAEGWAAAIGSAAQVVPGRGLLGGGSTPGQTLSSWLVAISPGPGTTSAALERTLRAGEPAVLARIEGDRLLLDPRTVFDAQSEPLVQAVRAALSSEESGPVG